MNKTNNSNRLWFIQVIDIKNQEIITVYDNGQVYGTEQGQKLATLNQETVNRLKGILNGTLDEKGLPFNEKTIFNRINYMYFFKNNPNMVFSSSKIILKIRDDSPKKQKIKVVGWFVTNNLLSLIKNPKNWI